MCLRGRLASIRRRRTRNNNVGASRKRIEGTKHSRVKPCSDPFFVALSAGKKVVTARPSDPVRRSSAMSDTPASGNPRQPKWQPRGSTLTDIWRFCQSKPAGQRLVATPDETTDQTVGFDSLRSRQVWTGGGFLETIFLLETPSRRGPRRISVRCSIAPCRFAPFPSD